MTVMILTNSMILTFLLFCRVFPLTRAYLNNVVWVNLLNLNDCKYTTYIKTASFHSILCLWGLYTFFWVATVNFFLLLFRIETQCTHIAISLPVVLWIDNELFLGFAYCKQCCYDCSYICILILIFITFPGIYTLSRFARSWVCIQST